MIKLRLALGIATAAEASKAIGVPFVTYRHHEEGRRMPSRTSAAIYSEFFGRRFGRHVPASLFLIEEAPAVVTRLVPVVGILDKSGRINDTASIILTPSKVLAPPIHFPRPLVAIAISTDAFYPAFRRRDAVFYEPDICAPIEPETECVVQSIDGVKMIRFVTFQGNGLYTTWGYDLVPTRNVSLVMVSPILFVQRNSFKG